MVDPPWQATSKILDDDLRALLYRLEPALVIDLCLLEWASVLTNMPRPPREQSEAWLRIIDTADAWVAVDFPLRGRDALDLGLAEGPRIAEVLKHVEDWWTLGGCRADRDACLRKLRGGRGGSHESRRWVRPVWPREAEFHSELRIIL